METEPARGSPHSHAHSRHAPILPEPPRQPGAWVQRLKFGPEAPEGASARTLEVNADSICSAEDDRYYVQSATEPSCTYLIKLGKRSCNCEDWPRVQLCKHVTAVAHFFGAGDELMANQGAGAPQTGSPVESESPPDDTRSGEAAASILEKVITISQEFLSDGVPSSLGTVRSLHMVEAHLNVVVWNSCSSESPLPEKENIAPNQHTWAETARKMGVQQRKRPRPASMSSPEPPATQRIGGLNRKQPWMLTDSVCKSSLVTGKRPGPDQTRTCQDCKLVGLFRTVDRSPVYSPLVI